MTASEHRRGPMDRNWYVSMEQLKSMVSTSVEALGVAGNSNQWQPADNSIAADELRDAEYGSGAHLALAIGRAYMIAATEGLEVLSELLVRSTPVAFATYPTARMAVEALSRANWLYQVDLGPRPRTERALALLIDAVRERLSIPEVDREQVRQGLSVVERSAASSDIPLDYKKGLPTRVVGMDIPSKRKLVGELLEDPDLGGSVYWTLSDLSHANVAALLGHLDDDDVESSLLVDEADTRLLVAALLTAWWNSTGRLVDLLGWRDHAYEERVQWVDRNIAAMLEPLRTR